MMPDAQSQIDLAKCAVDPRSPREGGVLHFDRLREMPSTVWVIVGSPKQAQYKAVQQSLESLELKRMFYAQNLRQH